MGLAPINFEEMIIIFQNSVINSINAFNTLSDMFKEKPHEIKDEPEPKENDL